MSGKAALDRKLQALESLRAEPQSEATLEQLRKALKDRNNYAVSKAAAIVAELRLEVLIPDLIGAFDRFLQQPAKSDPQCWAKNAIAQALKNLGHTDIEVFVRGLQHFQPEPVWGGHVDTAATLRATCAFALTATNLRDVEVLRYLVDVLADPEKPVRIDAARAIAQLSSPDSILLLRLKALTGDREAEVTGQCLAGLVSLEGRDSLPFIARFLKSTDADVRVEAVAALSEANETAAVEMLKQHWATELDHEVRQVIVRALAASPVREAPVFLLTLVADGSNEFAALAIEALGKSRFRSEFHERVGEIVRDRNDARLRERFERTFQ